ncbi:chemoreceptor glutamine deamidase CheD [Pleomorphomonas sp. PLEO]|uniref:chemoreceptor glutamine deamidase CheD n=1 Tax=Pleomorphomonas sp. PLEO TaxID=3239306 RepID=UPI00351F1D22
MRGAGQTKPTELPESDAGPCRQTAGHAYNLRRGTQAVRVLPGEAYVTGHTDEMIVTVLGSCVAACVRNPATGFGGLNHFMLPESDSGIWNGASAALRYGNYAMEVLINEVLKSGCRRRDLEIKLFGGADLTDGTTLIGSSNVSFVLDYLKAENLAIASADLGGGYGRRIHYTPSTGVVHRLLLGTSVHPAFVEEEHSFKDRLAKTKVEGEVDLF